jgi:hypothetical protein
MKIQCVCGSTVHDITDGQENKARYVSDECWESMNEEIEVNKSPYGVTDKYMRHIFQCYECSRLLVQDKDGNFQSFSPDIKADFGILKS